MSGNYNIDSLSQFCAQLEDTVVKVHRLRQENVFLEKRYTDLEEEKQQLDRDIDEGEVQHRNTLEIHGGNLWHKTGTMCSQDQEEAGRKISVCRKQFKQVSVEFGRIAYQVEGVNKYKFVKVENFM